MNITCGEGTEPSRATALTVALPLVSFEGIASARRLQGLFAAGITCLVFCLNRNVGLSGN
jgi:hypothetical protein